ncbi:MAG: ABC transporter ATP-binding protein/permease [Clostridia bacterium]|nr:ABC transporter ATP-binding protein/permease [Clostridia bacterium]
MLKLTNITKDYVMGDSTVHALRGVGMSFRESEFVSILGPSGCGKTTLLNIIGGLDKYTSGDLIINGKSTKDFKDRDWDTYRNHSIGFVFQSYNLIPHQSVLQNVEIALALSGVPKAERRERAKNALIEVGLSSEINKKPNQLSGGQMQRVAIARALVNNPDIILADEPTGALDTETSVQVMDILKKVSQNRLVVMVTHNPDLAEHYSTRIIKMQDGLIISDSMPMSEEEIERARLLDKEKKATESVVVKGKKKLKKRPSMSLLTAFSFSLKNLFTKKGRTTLTAFAGSIGIIGIALIFAVSQGMTSYINYVQEETLSAYPLTIEAEHQDLGGMIQAFMDSAKSTSEHENDAVYEKTALFDLVNAFNSAESKQNDLNSFKVWLEEQMADEDSVMSQALSGYSYGYGLDLNVYTQNVDGKIVMSDTQALIAEMLLKFSGSTSMMEGMNQTSSMFGMSSDALGLWQELVPGKNGESVNEVILSQYDQIVEGGRWPESRDEVVLVVDKSNEIDDMTLYALGLKSEEEIDEIVNAALSGKKLDKKVNSWSYEDILGMEFKVVLNPDRYEKNAETGLYEDKTLTETGLKILYETKGIDLKVVGIVRPKADAMAKSLTGSICYTYKLTDYVIEHNKQSNSLIAQLENPYIDIFSGLLFKDSGQNLTAEEKAEKFSEYVQKMSQKDKAEAYIKIKCIMSEEDLNSSLTAMRFVYNTREKKTEFLAPIIAMSANLEPSAIEAYLAGMSDEEFEAIFVQIATSVIREDYAMTQRRNYGAKPVEELVTAFDVEMADYTVEQKSSYYDVALVFSENDYKTNLRTLGYVDTSEPTSVKLYMSTFESKDLVEAEIAKYNAKVGEEKEIKYNDYIDMMLSSVTTIIDVITYVLIAFVAISLVVSSIMIGVITLISVQERTKEIGILRAIGASKKNVSAMFNAETVIIGFAAGLLGVLVTYLLCIPINLILAAATGIGNLKAILPLPVALILILISLLLTLISGIIPSRSAAKKDPVVALRTE